MSVNIIMVPGIMMNVCPSLHVGMEVAAYLSDKAASVSCIDIAAVPFERVLGDRVGRMLQTVQCSVIPQLIKGNNQWL